MSNSKLRGGVVSTIRVNPTDCLSILDVIDQLGINSPGMSFAQKVSLTLGSLLETARKQKLIPEPDPFEYLNRMEPYLHGKNNKRKQAMTDAIVGAGALVQVSSLAQPRRAEVTDAGATSYNNPEGFIQPDDDEPTPEQREARRELTDLLQKKDMVDAGVKDISWSKSDQERYDFLMAAVYGG